MDKVTKEILSSWKCEGRKHHKWGLVQFMNEVLLFYCIRCLKMVERQYLTKNFRKTKKEK